MLSASFEQRNQLSKSLPGLRRRQIDQFHFAEIKLIGIDFIGPDAPD